MIGCSQSKEAKEAPKIASVTPTRLSAIHLPNSVQLHPKVISGGLPEGNAGFQELKTLGVKTVISVDGAKPDVKTATKFGLRYVHLPHGYDGIPAVRVKELAKAVRDLEGPIYIHCHHGKHRSPAAASVACVSAGMLQKSDAIAVLSIADTSPNYRGLYDSVRESHPFEKTLLDELDVQYRSTVNVTQMAKAMVAIEHTHDRLKAIVAANWQTPNDHPDLEPAHEALLLREHFTELLRLKSVSNQNDAFKELLRQSIQSAQALEDALHKWNLDAIDSTPSLSRISARIEANCRACHRQFRDVPLGASSLHFSTPVRVASD